MSPLAKKWQRTGLLERLSFDGAEKMARLLENQARRLIELSNSKNDEWQQRNLLYVVRLAFAEAVEKPNFHVLMIPSDIIDKQIVIAKTREIAFRQPVPTTLNCYAGIDAETEACCMISAEIMEDIPPMVYIPIQALKFDGDVVIGYISRVGEISSCV